MNAKWGWVVAILTLLGLGFAAMSTNPPFSIPIWIPIAFFVAAGLATCWLISLLFMDWRHRKRKHEELLEAARNADPAVSLKDMALKVAEVAEGIDDEVESDSLKLTSMMLTDKAIAIIKQRQQLSSNKDKDTPKLPHPPELEIIYISSKYGIENGVNIITVWAEYRPTGKMRIEQLELCLIGSRIPCLDWKVMEASQDLWFTSDNKFELPSKTSSGKHSAELFAFANGEWWRSHPFSIEVNS
jgi:hypothetical protein